jgi:hypothetical protein
MGGGEFTTNVTLTVWGLLLAALEVMGTEAA